MTVHRSAVASVPRDVVEASLPMKALIIRSPWIDLILSGRKVWEMRSRATHIRGRIALIRAGSGQVVGTACLSDCLSSLDANAMARFEDRHAIPVGGQADALARGWTVPWVLTDVRCLPQPVPYVHPFGAVTWVELSPSVVDAMAAHRQQPDRFHGASPGPVRSLIAEAPRDTVVRPKITGTFPAPHVACAPASTPSARFNPYVDIVLSGGNIRNNHFYLRTVRSMLPADSLGGARQALAGVPITVHFEGGVTVETDVASDKMILRARSAVGDFFERTGCVEGDVVRFTRLAEREFRVERRQA